MSEAYAVAKADIAATVATFHTNGGHLCESYRSNTAACYGNTDLTWSSAGFVVSMLDAMLGLSPDAPRNALDWTINLTEAHTISNLRFGANTVTLSSAARDAVSSGARLTVTCPSCGTANEPGE